MRTSYAAPLLTVGWLAAMMAFGGYSSAADTIVIEATSRSSWKSNGRESDGEKTPLIVAAKRRDILEIRVASGTGGHGLVTLDKKGNESPKPLLSLVQTCGEDAPAKPDAVLREIDCQGGQSNFARLFVGVMKLEVLDRFQNDVHFWCPRHTSDMWGTVQLKR